MKVAYCLVLMKQMWTDMKRHTISKLVERAVPTNVVIVCIPVMSTCIASCDHLRIRCTSITTLTVSLCGCATTSFS